MRWELGAGFETLRTAIPDGLRAVIEPRLERLGTDERRVLEAASVVGPEFPAHAVAAVAPADSDLGDVESVEQLCDGLARRQDILRAAGESAWPDGTASARYAFRHALYQQVVYQRPVVLDPPATASDDRRAARDRLRAGARRTIASELAAHFERSRDVDRAIRYHAEAAAHAGSRVAYQETRLHLEAALDLLRAQPETPERLQQEMLAAAGPRLDVVRPQQAGATRMPRAPSRGCASSPSASTSRRCGCARWTACCIVHTMRAELTTARALGEEMLALAEPARRPGRDRQFPRQSRRDAAQPR